MKDLKQILATALTLCILSASALALDTQRNEPKPPPPPKDKKEIVKEDKRPPQQSPRNDNSRGNDNRRGKP